MYKLESKKGFDFNRIADRIRKLGTNDYSYRKALVYRENIINQLNNLKKNSESFKILFDYLKF